MDFSFIISFPLYLKKSILYPTFLCSFLCLSPPICALVPIFRRPPCLITDKICAICCMSQLLFRFFGSLGINLSLAVYCTTINRIDLCGLETGLCDFLCVQLANSSKLCQIPNVVWWLHHKYWSYLNVKYVDGNQKCKCHLYLGLEYALKEEAHVTIRGN